MIALSIYYVEILPTSESMSEFLESLMVDAIPYTKELVNFVAFYTIDSAENKNYCLFSLTHVESYLKESINPKDSKFANRMKGKIIRVQLGKEMTCSELPIFDEHPNSPYLQTKSESFFNIENFEFDFTANDLRVEPYNRKIVGYNDSISFTGVNRNRKGYSGGYDVDAAFGGQSDAYWNVD